MSTAVVRRQRRAIVANPTREELIELVKKIKNQASSEEECIEWSNGNLFVNPCATCHGGFGWGTIHGTSQVLGAGANGDSGSPSAYWFTNGASLCY